MADVLKGGAKPRRVDGKAPQGNRYFYWEFHERGFQQAVWWSGWKAIRRKPGGPVELYDVALDPGEKADVAISEPDTLRAITRIMDGARTESKEWPVKR